jgi:O-antigen ligase
MERLFPLKTESQQNIFWGVLAISAMSVYTLASIYLSQSLVLFFFTIVLVFLATAMHPKAGLYTIFICTMWFERHFTLMPLQIGATAYKIYPLDFCILFVALSLAARLIEGKVKWRPQALDWFILVFGAVCSLGFVGAYWKNLDMAYAFGTYKNYFLYAVVYFISSAMLTTKEDWHQLIRWLTVGGIGTFFFLFYGLIVGRGLWSEFTPLSTAGERMIAGTHVFYLLIFFFFLLGAFLFRDAAKKYPGWKAALSVIAMSLTGVALVVSLVRHLWLAMIFIFVFWLIFLNDWRQRLRYLAVVAGVAVLTACMVFSYTQIGKLIHGTSSGQTINNISTVLTDRTNVDYVIGGSDSSFHWRLTVWRVGFTAWIAHPFLGLGLGYEISGLENNWPFHVALREIHNDYLAILYQLGVIGFIALIEWFIYMCYRFITARQSQILGDWEEGRLFFIFSSIALLFMVGFSISIYWDINLFVIWWWLSLAALRFLWIKKATRKIIYEDTSDK